MNEEELDIAKRIAEIEGVNVDSFTYKGSFLLFNKDVDCGSREYNPFDWSILGPLMIKYKCEIKYSKRMIDGLIWINSKHNSYFSNRDKIPRAILECIIKSQEL